MLFCKNAVQRYSFYFNLPNIFCTFAAKLTIYMKINRKIIGLGLIFFGSALLLISFSAGWTSSNPLLISCLAMIVAGIVLYSSSGVMSL